MMSKTSIAAGVIVAGAAVFTWPLIKPALVSAVGVHAAVALALVASVFAYFAVRFVLSRVVQWLKAEEPLPQFTPPPTPGPPKVVVPAPVEIEVKPMSFVKKVEAVTDALKALRAEIEKKSSEGTIIANMLKFLTTARNSLGGLGPTNETTEFTKIPDTVKEMTEPFVTILTPVYNCLMNQTSHRALPSSCNTLCTHINQEMPRILQLAQVTVAEGTPPNCTLKSLAS